jgi:hypothetical protein
VDKKGHYYPTPAQSCGGTGKGGCDLYGPEDLINKNVSILKMAFLMKTSKKSLL